MDSTLLKLAINSCHQSFPISSKFHWTVGPVNLKLLLDQKKSPNSMRPMAYSYLVRPKKLPKNITDQKNKQIVGPMWLGICQTYLCFT